MVDSSTAQFKVSVVLESRLKTVGKWSVLQWDLLQVLSDPKGPDFLEGPLTLRESESGSQIMWKGLRLKLFADSAEGYWYNLLSDTPYAFVLCEYDTEGEQDDPPVPILITANQDEAGGHLEADNLVLSGPLPVDIRDAVERFVVHNYVPEKRRKRKRRDWFKEANRRDDQDA